MTLKTNAQRLEHLLAELELLVKGVKCNTGFDDCGCWICQIRAVLERAPRPVGLTGETQRLIQNLVLVEQRERVAELIEKQCDHALALIALVEEVDST
jgi:hypothetical protein